MRTMMKTALAFLFFASVGCISHDEGIQISGGTDAAPGQFPYMAAIHDVRYDRYLCGGILIDPGWVLTNYLCVRNWNRDPVQVILGLHDYDNFENGGQPEVYEVELMVQDQLYYGSWALLKLTNPVTPGNPFIQTIELAPSDEFDYTGAECLFTGWGERQRFAGNVGGVLQYIPAEVASLDCCMYSADPEKKFCVPEIGTCDGDDGGPLVCQRDGQTYLVGQLAGGTSFCGQMPEKGSLFDKMSYYGFWIKFLMYEVPYPSE